MTMDLIDHTEQLRSALDKRGFEREDHQSPGRTWTIHRCGFRWVAIYNGGAVDLFDDTEAWAFRSGAPEALRWVHGVAAWLAEGVEVDRNPEALGTQLRTWATQLTHEATLLNGRLASLKPSPENIRPRVRLTARRNAVVEHLGRVEALLRVES